MNLFLYIVEHTHIRTTTKHMDFQSSLQLLDVYVDTLNYYVHCKKQVANRWISVKTFQIITAKKTPL